MAKKRKFITRKRLKWMGTFACLLVLSVYVASNWYAVSVSRNGTQRRANAFIGFGRFICAWSKESEPVLPPDSSFYYYRPRDSRIVFEFEWEWQSKPSAKYDSEVFIAIPLWLPLLLIAAPTAWLWRADRRAKPWQCDNCRYDLRGLEGEGNEKWDGACPECGTLAEHKA